MTRPAPRKGDGDRTPATATPTGTDGDRNSDPRDSPTPTATPPRTAPDTRAPHPHPTGRTARPALYRRPRTAGQDGNDGRRQATRQDGRRRDERRPHETPTTATPNDDTSALTYCPNAHPRVSRATPNGGDGRQDRQATTGRTDSAPARITGARDGDTDGQPPHRKDGQGRTRPPKGGTGRDRTPRTRRDRDSPTGHRSPHDTDGDPTDGHPAPTVSRLSYGNG